MSDSSGETSHNAVWPIRTLLFVPSTHPEWIPKAIESGPDAIILDLEDSVAPSEKLRARSLIPKEIEALQSRGVHAFVKTNAVPQGGLDDLRACILPGLTGIILPKAASVEEIRRVHDAMSYAEGRAGMAHGEVSIIALPETAEGLRFAYDIARASPRVKGLLGGSSPIQGDMAAAVGYRATVEGTEQQYLTSKLVLDSRAAGAMYPIGGIFATRIDDLAMVEMLVRRAKTIGFSGVHVIHPTHVGIANRVMRPTAEEVDYFQGLIAALEEGHRQGRGAVRYRGMMVDHAMLETAHEVVAEARRLRARD